MNGPLELIFYPNPLIFTKEETEIGGRVVHYEWKWKWVKLLLGFDLSGLLNSWATAVWTKFECTLGLAC